MDLELTPEELAWIRRHAWHPRKVVKSYEKLLGGEKVVGEVVTAVYLKKRAAINSLAPEI
jgi:hypothetical protein